MKRRWAVGTFSLITLFIITNFSIYLKVYLDRKNEPLYRLHLNADEINFLHSNKNSKTHLSPADLRLDINTESWIESHNSLTAIQPLGYCNGPPYKREDQKKREILALVELEGLDYDILRNQKKKAWEKCAEEFRYGKEKNKLACDWREEEFLRLSRLILKDVFFDKHALKSFESDKNKYMVLRGTLHASRCPSDTQTGRLHVSLESQVSIPDQLRHPVERAKKEKTRPIEAIIVVGQEYLLRLESFKL